ncbi:MAG: hypothetical protein IPK85_00435 [Gemmatimonadetes bacterium]|nr:hypothetical protein [Gemmatimonadota bacterium]
MSRSFLPSSRSPWRRSPTPSALTSSATWIRVGSAARRAPSRPPGTRPSLAGDMGTGRGSPITIAQDAARLVVTFNYFTAYDLQPKVRLALRPRREVSRATGS